MNVSGDSKGRRSEMDQAVIFVGGLARSLLRKPRLQRTEIRKIRIDRLLQVLGVEVGVIFLGDAGVGVSQQFGQRQNGDALLSEQTGKRIS
jgi:hypothetical protein